MVRWDMVLELQSGAKAVRPDKTVINIAGDGCFRMNMNEIATAARI
ncbi:MAG: thiamine pyrophosphate-dependent enzyme [Blautia sp.]